MTESITVPEWSHDRLQADLVIRRRNRKATMAWAEVNISHRDSGRFDVFEARHHDARNETVFVGFEVKASVSDLESDLSTGKWKRYLPACDELYFAVPKGLCDVSDIPDTCGVLYRIGEPYSGRWNIGRKPKGGHRRMSDTDVWHRLASKGYYNTYGAVQRDTRTRLERMRDYAEQDSLSHLINSRVKEEIRKQKWDLDTKRQRIEDLELQTTKVEDLEQRLVTLAPIIEAINVITRAAHTNLYPATRHTRTAVPMLTIEEAITVLTNGGNK